MRRVGWRSFSTLLELATAAKSSSLGVLLRVAIGSLLMGHPYSHTFDATTRFDCADCVQRNNPFRNGRFVTVLSSPSRPGELGDMPCWWPRGASASKQSAVRRFTELPAALTVVMASVAGPCSSVLPTGSKLLFGRFPDAAPATVSPHAFSHLWHRPSCRGRQREDSSFFS